MSKDTELRITETITFVEQHPVADATSAADHTLIVTWLRTWKQVTSTATKARLSALMSQEDAHHRAGSAGGRAYIRASTLVKCAIALPESGWADAARGDKFTPAGQGDGIYTGALRAARDHIRSTPFHVNRMLADLRGDPLTFLGHTKLVINGGNKAGNPVSYKVAMKDGAYSFDCYGANQGRVTVKAVNVMATKYAAVSANLGALPAVDSAVDASCDLLLTTQFTGCTFCFARSPDGSNMLAAHIDPGLGTGVSGTAMSQSIRGGGGLAGAGNGGAFQAYGRVPNGSGLFGYPESAAQMTIVGVRDAGDWNLYSQITALDGGLTANRIAG